MAICWHSVAVPSPPTNAFAAGSHAMSPTATTTGTSGPVGTGTESVSTGGVDAPRSLVTSTTTAVTSTSPPMTRATIRY